jgi:hypothetical protein
MGDKGPLGGQSADDGPHGESRSSRPNSADTPGSSGRSGPKNQNPPYQSPREEEVSEKRSASSASSAGTHWSADPMRSYRMGRNEPEASE